MLEKITNLEKFVKIEWVTYGVMSPPPQQIPPDTIH